MCKYEKTVKFIEFVNKRVEEGVVINDAVCEAVNLNRAILSGMVFEMQKQFEHEDIVDLIVEHLYDRSADCEAIIGHFEVEKMLLDNYKDLLTRALEIYSRWQYGNDIQDTRMLELDAAVSEDEQYSEMMDFLMDKLELEELKE